MMEGGEGGATMRRLLRMVCFLALGLAPSLSAMATDNDCIISDDSALSKESGPGAEISVGNESRCCVDKKAGDVGNQADPAAHETDPGSVVGKTWQWAASITAVEKVTVPNPDRYTILLTKDGKLQARFDCNRGGGDYKVSAGRLSFGPMLSTRMACPPDSLDGFFMSGLAKVNSFFVQDGKLFLELEGDGGTMHFCPAPW
jgi:heat shock protein HslJ